jgi:outer membrane beta-barrel protein
VRKALLLVFSLLPAVALGQAEELLNPGSVSAVQDRAYRMGHELTLGVGVLPLDAFYKGLTAQVAYTYHFSDSFAWQVGRGMYSYNVDTGLKEQLERDFTASPTAFDQVNWMVGSDLVWSPFYGKMAFLNRSVTHFEAFVSGGLSVLKLTLANSLDSGILGLTGNLRPAINLGVGVRVYTSKAVSWRLDITNNVVFSNKIFNVPVLQLALALNFGASE